MRIALVTHYYPAHRGGVERVAGELAARLARRGDAEVSWHASDCDAPPAPQPGVDCAPARSCNWIEQRLGFPFPLWTPAALARLARAARAADVVHLHDCLYLANVVAFLAARLARRPVLVTQHVGFIPYRNPVLRALLSAANHVLGRVVLGGADRVVFESETVRRYFARFVRFRAEPQLVPNGVDTGTFSPADAAERHRLRARFGVGDDAMLFLFAGRFVEKKGMPLLSELTGRVPGARWIFAGLGPIDPESWRRPNVTVVRAPDIAALLPLYRAADLLVLPSVGEGVPLVLQEAMACGTPALVGAATAAGCPPNAPILAEEPGGEDALERWAVRLEAFLRAPEQLRDLRPLVAAFAREHWSWERCTQRYADILRDCAGRA